MKKNLVFWKSKKSSIFRGEHFRFIKKYANEFSQVYSSIAKNTLQYKSLILRHNNTLKNNEKLL